MSIKYLKLLMSNNQSSVFACAGKKGCKLKTHIVVVNISYVKNATQIGYIDQQRHIPTKCIRPDTQRPRKVSIGPAPHTQTNQFANSIVYKRTTQPETAGNKQIKTAGNKQINTSKDKQTLVVC